MKLIGGSKKLTAGAWLVPAAATFTVIFDKWGIGPEMAESFWSLLETFCYMYFGGQSAVDTVKEAKELVLRRKPIGGTEDEKDITVVSGHAVGSGPAGG